MYNDDCIRKRTSLWCPKCRKWIDEYNVSLNDFICTSCDELNLDDLYRKGAIEKLVELVNIENGNILKTYRTNYSKEKKKMFDFDRLDKSFEKLGEIFNNFDNLFKGKNDVKVFVNGKNVTKDILDSINKEKTEKDLKDYVNKNIRNSINKEDPNKLKDRIVYVKNFIKKVIFSLFDDTNSCMSFDPEDGLNFMNGFINDEKFIKRIACMTKEDAYKEIVTKFNIYNVFKKNLVKTVKIQTPFEFVVNYNIAKIEKNGDFSYKLILKDNENYFFIVNLINESLALDKDYNLLCMKENYNWEIIQKKLNKLFFDSFICNSKPEKK